ncbi:hypothetical protein [Oryza sativa Japonica Group]|uniref:Uncharacterized protein n=2 Tax=Oryza sativa subsp. japonica TaxID=39947 RepID=Q1EHT1_ORYSJ|nr:hypothetical protein [Oryza sativa Japonica Group]BAE95824.1 hypothetical protein [Oryza sativa Japonica Group]
MGAAAAAPCVVVAAPRRVASPAPRLATAVAPPPSPRYSSPGLAALSAPTVAVRISHRRRLVRLLSRIVHMGADECGGVRARILSRSSGGSKNSDVGFGGGGVTHARNVICVAASSRLIRLLAVPITALFHGLYGSIKILHDQLRRG